MYGKDGMGGFTPHDCCYSAFRFTPLGPGRLVLLRFGGANSLFEIISCCCVTEGQPPQPSTTLLLRVGVNPPTPSATPVLVVW